MQLNGLILRAIELSADQALKESKDLVLRIKRRNFFQLCNEYAVPKDNLEHFKNVTAQDIFCSQKSGDVILREDVAVTNIKIDLTRGRHNPLESDFFHMMVEVVVGKSTDENQIFVKGSPPVSSQILLRSLILLMASNQFELKYGLILVIQLVCFYLVL